tara:strand:+ start:1854 stop:2030 length:177 start_codon:yes stop_codon:yes gene_type:complete
MARVTPVFPEPVEEYNVSSQRQLVEALDTLKNQLNFGYQDELKQEVERFTWFSMRFGC